MTCHPRLGGASCKEAGVIGVTPDDLYMDECLFLLAVCKVAGIS